MTLVWRDFRQEEIKSSRNRDYHKIIILSLRDSFSWGDGKSHRFDVTITGFSWGRDRKFEKSRLSKNYHYVSMRFLFHSGCLQTILFTWRGRVVYTAENFQLFWILKRFWIIFSHLNFWNFILIFIHRLQLSMVKLERKDMTRESNHFQDLKNLDFPTFGVIFGYSVGAVQED